MTTPKRAKQFYQFKDVMDKYGRFEGRTIPDVNYQTYNVYAVIKKWKKEMSAEEKDGEKPKELTEDQEFYDQLKTLPGFSVSGTRKELHHLRTILYEGEQVLAVTSGFMDDNTWLIACTDKRVLFIDCGMLYGVNHTEVLIDKINAVSFENRLKFGDIKIQDGAGTKEIRTVPINSTKPFVDAVHKAMDQHKENDRIVVQNQTTSTADELLKYKQLLDMGAITEEEFAKVKEKLLK